MRNLVGVLAIVLTLLLITAGSTQAGENLNTKKYGIEFKLGGGFYAMQDVNDFIPHPDFINPAIMGADEKRFILVLNWESVFHIAHKKTTDGCLASIHLRLAYL